MHPRPERSTTTKFSAIIPAVMNPALVPWIASAVIAAVFAWPTTDADAKSAKQVFAEVARSVVVVLAAGSDGEVASQGSGVVVGDNEVATNCHVLDDAASVSVRQAADAGGGESYRMAARVLARDDERDLCLLFVEELSAPPAAPVAAMGTAKGLSVGEEVFAIGAPKGLELSMSRGIVSQLRGIHGKRAAPLVQTDAAISPGSSGGGLFNEDGELVGITTFKWKGESLNHALPVEWIGELLEKDRLAAEKQRECTVNPDYECVIAVALFAARNIGDADDRIEMLRGLTLALASAQAKAGNIKEALATTRSIDKNFRHDALRDIALAQAEAGDMRSARDTFAAMLSVAQINDSTFLRPWSVRNIASAQAEAGDIDGALATARSIDDELILSWTLDDIAVEQMATGDEQSARDTLAVALSVARKIDDKKERVSALSFVAAAHAKTGNTQSARDILATALSVARNIDVAFYRASALHRIALAQAEAGDAQSAQGTFAAMLSVAQMVDDEFNSYHLDSALRGIVSVQAQTGDMDGAFATARGIDNVESRAGALHDIASAQAQAGDKQSARDTFAAALSAARNIDDASSRAGALRNIAPAQAKAGDTDGAFATARSIDDALFRAGALWGIASAQAEAGDFRDAMKTAMGIENNHARAMALTAIAKQLTAREGK